MGSYINNEIQIKSFGSVYYFEFGKDFTHPPEKHNSWEMVYVDKGSIIAVTDGVGASLEQGQAIFHQPDEVHAHISDRERANNMLVVSFCCDSAAMDFFRKKTFTFDKTARTLLSLFIEEVKNGLGCIPGDFTNHTCPDFSKEKFGASQLMSQYFSELLIKLIRSGSELGDVISSNPESRNMGKNGMVELMCGYLQENIYNPITLQDLYGRFFVGKSKMNAIFRECTGKSPKEYFNDLKMQEAKRLLRESDMSVSEMTDKLCYSGIQNFSRAFKKATGFSPMEYKKSII